MLSIMEKAHTRIHKAGHEIRSVEDWFMYAPPKTGERQWEDGRSEKELARSWFRKGFACPPEEMRVLLERAFRTEIAFDEAKPECVIKVDVFAREHRNCDLVVLCNVGAKRMVINVEAKADELFGGVTGEYYDRKTGSGSKVPARIRYRRHCSDESQMKRFETFAISFCTQLPPHWSKQQRAEQNWDCSWFTSSGLQA